ncbi:MAG: hypothetical protein ACJAWZ_002783, partial [Paracoccaceae bacterium]
MALRVVLDLAGLMQGWRHLSRCGAAELSVAISVVGPLDGGYHD